MRKPVFPYLISYVFSKYWPAGYLSILFSGMIFALGWFVLIYLIGCRAFTPAVSFAAVCVMAGANITYELFGHFVNDIHLCFFSAAILLLLVSRDRMVQIGQWIILGILIGLGLLSKPTLPVYVWGAILLMIIVTVRHIRETGEQNLWLNVGTGALISLVLALILWLPWFQNPIDNIRLNLEVIASNPGKNYAWFHSFSGDLPHVDMALAAGWPATILLLIGFCVSLFRLQGARRLALIGAMMPTMALFGIFAVSFSRLTYPVWFIAALFAFDLLDDIPQEKLRPWIIGCAGLFFVLFSAQRPLSLTPDPNPKNPAYLPAQVSQYIQENNLLEKPADALFFDRCQYKKEAFPLGLFMVLNLQDVPNTEFVHFYDGTNPQPINDDNLDTFKRRLNGVNMLVVCDNEKEGRKIDPKAILKETYAGMIAFRPECCSGFYYPPALEYQASFDDYSDHQFGSKGFSYYHLFTKPR